MAVAVALVGAAATAGTGAAEAHVTPPPGEPTAERIECAAWMSTEDQVAQTLLALVSTPAQLGDITELFGQRRIGGIAPLGDLITSADWDEGSFGEATASLDRFDVPGLFASDEEGGSVQRFRDALGPIPSARQQVETMSPAEVEAMYASYGAELATFGVSMAFAPVVDIGGGPAIGNRSYGDDPAVVIEFAGAAIAGYLSAGITPVLKHFPGHGRASADTHNGAATTPPIDELRSSDLLPYEALLSDDIAIMVGHLDVPGLTDGAPASLSSDAITGVLRRELGFAGLVISDALGMGAIRQLATGPEAAVMFLQAGGDLALIDAVDAVDAHAAIVAAVASGRLEPFRLHQAVTQVLRVKHVAGDCATPWGLIATASSRGALLSRFA